MIEVIGFRFEKDELDHNGHLIHRKGDVIVSHGVNCDTLENVILPQENYTQFVAEHCYRKDNSYFLKEN